MYELTLDSNSNVKKIVENSKKALYSSGKILEYNIGNREFKSNRGNLIKKYVTATTNAPKMRDFLPQIKLNGLHGHYAELLDGEEIVSREWYMTFDNEESFFDVYKSLGHIPPVGELYEEFKSDIRRYRLKICPKGYDYCLSVELAKNNEITIDWYMVTTKEIAKEIIKEWQK